SQLFLSFSDTTPSVGNSPELLLKGRRSRAAKVRSFLMTGTKAQETTDHTEPDRTDESINAFRSFAIQICAICEICGLLLGGLLKTRRCRGCAETGLRRGYC